MKMKRLAFARKYLNWSAQQWIDVTFLGKLIFRLINSRTVTVKRPRITSRYKNKFTISTIKHSVLVMAWGCSSRRLVGEASAFCPRT
jgi:hypothetical protein